MENKLSSNEKKVLKCLLEDGRMSRTDIGKRIDMTSQGVARIERKLKDQGIIKGYSVNIDHEIMGVGVFAIAFFRLKSGTWNTLSKDNIKERMKGPNIIKLYRFSEGDITHMIIYGFKTLKDADNYFHILQTERGHISELIKVNILSSSSLLKDSSRDLFEKILDENGEDEMARPPHPPELDSSW